MDTKHCLGLDSNALGKCLHNLILGYKCAISLARIPKGTPLLSLSLSTSDVLMVGEGLGGGRNLKIKNKKIA
jgi:hypothetical protein